MLEIENVGLSMDSLHTIDGVVFGEATIYSVEDGEEYCDDFTFNYDISGDFVCCDLDLDLWGDNLSEIEELLIDNLKTNYL